MDVSVVNIALPTLQAYFHATASGIQWVVQSYALFCAALLLLGGAIGDRHGRRKTFTFGVVLFALASISCAISTSLVQMVVARAIQGVGAALLIPQGLSILSASFPEDKRGRAIGIWSAWTSIFTALGPIVGGWLIAVWSWRFVFLLNLPIVFLILLLIPRIPESRVARPEGTASSLDSIGALLATSSFAAIVYALSSASQSGWTDLKVIWLLLIGFILLGVFIRSQANRRNAMMPLRLFRSARFSVANLLTFFLDGAVGGALYVIPFYLIQVRHYAPAFAGAVFLPFVGLMFFFSSHVGTLSPKLGERLLLFIGASFAGLGFATFAWLDYLKAYWFAIFPGVILLGVGMTLAVAPLTTAVMSSVPEPETGVASAVNNTLSRLAALLAIPLLSLALTHGFDVNLTMELHRVNIPVEARNQIAANHARLHDTPIPDNLTAEQKADVASLIDRSFLVGFRLVMLACATTAWLGSLTVLLCHSSVFGRFGSSVATPGQPGSKSSRI
jgi:EmrB/QacA subfamily drug resistance transporter